MPEQTTRGHITEEVKSKIQAWLVEDGYQVEQNEDETADFHLTATHPQTHVAFDVIKPRNKPDMIAVAAGVGLAQNQVTRLRAIQEQKRVDFIWDIKFQLLSSGYDFQFSPDSTTTVEKVIVSVSLWFDGLNKHAFMNSLSKVNNGFILVLWKFSSELGSPNEKEPSDSGIG
ncbi:MAG: DUF2299 family protein [Nitrososphaerales archaeon]